MANIEKYFVIAILVCHHHLCDAYKILVVFPFPSQSHRILGDGMVRHLLAAGHEVTYITVFPNGTRPNLREVIVHGKPIQQILSMKGLLEKKSELNDQDFVFNLIISKTQKVLENENVQKLIQDPNERFDVVVAEWMFTELYCGFATVFDCPCVWFFPFEHSTAILSLIDGVPNPAYTPTFEMNAIPPFNFKQRLTALLYQLKTKISKFKHLKIERAMYHRSFASSVAKRQRPLPSYDEVRLNASLVLVNAHVSTGTARSTPKNYVDIGGYHIDERAGSLPENIKMLYDNSIHGIIYFSLGSNLQSKELPDEIKRELLKMFSGLKQTIIWKFEESLPDLPENVHIVQWAPQTSILAHPKCILFITHGGFLSTTEAVHFGKPIIGIPVFADQFLNVGVAVAKGFAKRVDFSYSMAEDLDVAIKDILSDPKYAERARELSRIYHDRPVSPGAELVHWVEHVVRTRGAPHLRSPALRVPWYQKMYLDLAALILAALIILAIAYNKLFSFSDDDELNEDDESEKKRI